MAIFQGQTPRKAYFTAVSWGPSLQVDVENVGGRDGDEVVQIYVRSPEGSGDRRVHHLADFRRVPLKAGEKTTVSFTLPESRFAQFGEDGRRIVAPGKYTVFAGGGQPGFADGVLSGTVDF